MNEIPIRLRCSGLCAVHCHGHPAGQGSWDPVPHLAAIIDGLHDMARLGEPGSRWWIAMGELLAGPYSALRGGLLLDEPGRKRVSTGDALREVLGEMPQVQKDALDAYARQNADVHRENTRLRDALAELQQARGDGSQP